MTTLTPPCCTCGKPTRLEYDDTNVLIVTAFKNFIARIQAGQIRCECTPCHERRERRHRIEDWISRCCGALQIERQAAARDKLRSSLFAAARKYADVMAEIKHLEAVCWDDRFPETLYENPREWAAILSHYRKTCNGQPVLV
jgi:hypothetical protein